MDYCGTALYTTLICTYWPDPMTYFNRELWYRESSRSGTFWGLTMKRLHQMTSPNDQTLGTSTQIIYHQFKESHSSTKLIATTKASDICISLGRIWRVGRTCSSSAAAVGVCLWIIDSSQSCPRLLRSPTQNLTLNRPPLSPVQITQISPSEDPEEI